MPRPPKCRRVSFLPGILYFKPAGIPVRELEEVTLALDEMEAIRLADLEGLYQEDAALRMNVSRQTFANILTSAHRKMAQALIHGKAVRIEGGNVEMNEPSFICPACRYAWNLPSGSDRPMTCPRCRNGEIHRDLDGKGPDGKKGEGCRQKKACCRKRLQEENE